MSFFGRCKYKWLASKEWVVDRVRCDVAGLLNIELASDVDPIVVHAIGIVVCSLWRANCRCQSGRGRCSFHNKSLCYDRQRVYDEMGSMKEHALLLLLMLGSLSEHVVRAARGA